MVGIVTLLSRYSAMLRSLNRIEEFYKNQSLSEFVDAVEAECADLAPPGRQGMRKLMRYWPLWKIVHHGARQHPCLYFAMLALAFETMAGRSAEVNIGLSTDAFEATDGHCWLTREGKKLYESCGASSNEYGECLGRRGRIVYWWRRTRVAASPSPDTRRLVRLWRKIWPT